MQLCIYNISNSTNHQMAADAVQRLATYQVTSGKYEAMEILNTLRWKQVMERCVENNLLYIIMHCKAKNN